MIKHTFTKAILAVVTSIGLTAGLNSVHAGGHGGKMDITKMSAEQLAEHLIFNSGGFKLEQKVQEGGLSGERLKQDDLQKACSIVGGGAVDGNTSVKVMNMARNDIKYPKGGIKLGDWKIGRELAWSGYGYRVGHRTDDHATTKNGPGGNCYNCHQMATDRTGGNIGPALTNYGKLRGNSDAILKYTYEVIYNPHAYFPCTNMPRIGAQNVLTEEQISHVMAYLFDPESPVNK